MYSLYIYSESSQQGPFVTNNRKFQVIPIMSITEFDQNLIGSKWRTKENVTALSQFQHLYVSCFIYIYKDYWLGALTLHVDYWDSALCFLQNKMTLTYSCSVFKNDFANKMNEVKTHLVRQAKYLVNTNLCI